MVHFLEQFSRFRRILRLMLKFNKYVLFKGTCSQRPVLGQTQAMVRLYHRRISEHIVTESDFLNLILDVTFYQQLLCY